MLGSTSSKRSLTPEHLSGPARQQQKAGRRGLLHEAVKGRVGARVAN